MFKDIKLVFNQIYFQTEKLPLILLIISLIVIFIITIILVRKELKKL